MVCCIIIILHLHDWLPIDIMYMQEYRGESVCGILTLYNIYIFIILVELKALVCHINGSDVVRPNSITIAFAEDSAGAIFAHTCSSEITFPSGLVLNDSPESYKHFIAIMNSVVDYNNSNGLKFKQCEKINANRPFIASM